MKTFEDQVRELKRSATRSQISGESLCTGVDYDMLVKLTTIAQAALWVAAVQLDPELSHEIDPSVKELATLVASYAT